MCSFGQSWPGRVWAPICYYFDTTVRHPLGIDWRDRGYWKAVPPHEVAHQWWAKRSGLAAGRLHMIRMMMDAKETGDQQFKETMQGFVNGYRGKVRHDGGL